MRKQIALLAAAAIAVNASAPVCFAKTITPNATAAASSKSTATADTEDRSDMEKALATVKSRITIPEEYSKFSCTTGESNGLKNYNFTWINSSNFCLSYELISEIYSVRFRKSEKDDADNSISSIGVFPFSYI